MKMTNYRHASGGDIKVQSMQYYSPETADAKQGLAQTLTCLIQIICTCINYSLISAGFQDDATATLLPSFTSIMAAEGVETTAKTHFPPEGGLGTDGSTPGGLKKSIVLSAFVGVCSSQAIFGLKL